MSCEPRLGVLGHVAGAVVENDVDRECRVHDSFDPVEEVAEVDRVVLAWDGLGQDLA